MLNPSKGEEESHRIYYLDGNLEGDFKLVTEEYLIVDLKKGKIKLRVEFPEIVYKDRTFTKKAYERIKVYTHILSIKR